MPNPYKIKRHKTVYKSGKHVNFGTIKIIGAILGFAVLFFVGYSIADPIIDFISGDMREEFDEKYAQQSSMDEVAPPPSSETESFVEGDVTRNMHGAYLPPDVFTDDERLEGFIEYAKQNGINTAFMYLKDEKGNLYFNSSTETAQEIGAVAENAADLDAVVAKLTENGITPAAVMQIFRDPLASVKIKGSNVRYSKDITVHWIDDTAANGGKPWLNPESEEAVDYTAELITELESRGIKAIVAKTAHYPKGVGLNLAYFGVKSNESRIGVLNDFIKSLEKSLEQSGCKLLISYEGTDYIKAESLVYGGEPKDVVSDIIAPTVIPAEFSKNVQMDKEIIADPAASPYEFTKVFVSELAIDVPETKIVPIINATTKEEQIKALDELGISAYIIYDENGNY